jgi:O-antigen/teichoic acid export membrane protein
MSGYLTGALAGLEGYRSLALISPIQGVLHITLLGVGAWVWGGYGAVIGLTLSSALRWILLRWVLLREADKHQIPWRGAKGRNEHNMLTRFSIPASLAGLSSMPALWLSNVFLIQQPGGYKEMGLYGAAFSLRTLIIIFPVILNNVTSSILNFQLGVGNDERYGKLFKANLLISVFIAILGMAVIIIFGRWILGLFGAEFQAGYPILFLLVLSTVPETLQNAIYQVIQSRGRMWLSLYGVSIPRDVTLIGMAYYFTRDYGASGLATAYTIAWTIALLCTIVIVWNLGIVRRSRRRGQE